MAYVSLYRKYRSQSFGEVIGQQHVTTVLQNALRMGRIAHAYLFCGPRGCGKTSTARLLARALNCLGPNGDATSATAEPCGTCALCSAIRAGSALDVIEMDAASETGIDDVREKIIENAKFAPAEARFKVYIIDEVHDLSLKAFDSLLKTIEEPPAHVVFILATTEAHKVPITIRSRCQRMDFRRGLLQDLISTITNVLDREGIEYEQEAVTAVARAAEGSFRDSLSLLEQALAYTDGGRLVAEAVHASIGTVGSQILDEVTATIASDDMYAAFLQAGKLVDSGKDVKQTLIALQAHLRDLLVAGVANGPQALADVSEDRFEQLRSQSARFTPPMLLKMLDILAESERSLRFTNQHQRILEMAMWKILPRHLRREPVSGAPDSPRAKPGPATAGGAPRPSSGAKERSVEVAPAAMPEIDANRASVEIVPPRLAPAPPQKAVEESEEGPSPWAAQIDIAGIRRVWPRVVKRVLQRSASARAYFGKEEVVRLENHQVFVGFPNEFVRSGADKQKGRELVETVLAEELGIKGWRVRCVLLSETVESVELPAQLSPSSLDMLPEPLAATANTRANGRASDGPDDGDGQAVVAPLSASLESSNETDPGGKDEDEQFLKLVLEEFDGKIVDE